MNGPRLSSCARKDAAFNGPLRVCRGRYRVQSPRKAPKEIGLESTINAAPVKDSQNFRLPQAIGGIECKGL